MRLQVLSTVTLVVLLVAACGGSTPDADSSAGNSAEDGRPQSFDDIDFRSPIGEFLGIDFSATDEMDAQFAEMEREAGLITAECMRDQGFEYVPIDSMQFASFGGPGDDLPYFSDAWVEKYGLGITTQRFPQSMVGDLVGFPDEQFGAPDEGFVDPNAEYIESLSPAEQDAYYAALYGDEPDFGPEGPGEDFTFEASGCQNEAFEQAFNDGPMGGQQAFYEAFGDDLEAMEERVQADPRIIEFNAMVTNCVTAAGLEWTGQEDVYSRFEQRLQDLQPAALRSSVDPFEEAGLDPEEMTDRELEDFFRDLNRLDAEGLAVLAELQAEELALAKVVVDCGGGLLNEQIIMSEVRIEYEQEFLDTNAAAMEAFKPE